GKNCPATETMRRRFSDTISHAFGTIPAPAFDRRSPPGPAHGSTAMARDLNDTLMFVKVVEQGSFTAAARQLGLPKTTVSRKVLELEARLGAQLLMRTTRRIGLTEAGTVYYEHCKRIARELEEAEGAVNQLQSG